MLVKIKTLCEKYGRSRSKLDCIISRSEFAKYTQGGNGGIYFDLNEESQELLEKFLAKGDERLNKWG